jgi:hypothetical protein
MGLIRRLHGEQRGIAMVAVMIAIFILTIVVAALAIATMGESRLSYDQYRGQQALGIAEAGAYRALAELRRRLSVDLDTQIRSPSVSSADIRAICQGAGSPPRERVELVTNYAYPTTLGASDWVRVGPTGYLRIGTAASRIQLTDTSTGAALGDFYATVAVRPSGAPATCQFGGSQPEQEVVYFDYAILAVGRSGNAVRQVCLRSQFADRCPNWFPAPGASWQGSYALSGNTYFGWPVYVEKASYSQWALMLLNVSGVWLYTGTQIFGPVHSNSDIRIAGDPALYDVVTQSNPTMTFLNCGSQTSIAVPPSNPNATLRTQGCDNTTGTVFRSTVTGGVAPIPAPTSANPSRTSIGLTPGGPNATDTEVNNATTQLPDGNAPVPNGLYVMDQCGTPGCGGIYVKGNVTQMVLVSNGNLQEIYVSVQSPGDPAKANVRLVIDPVTRSVTEYWGANWSNSQSWPPGTFNGIFYVSGSITSNSDPSVSSGLYGVVNRSMRLTIATEGEMRITDHLVYEAPPAGPGHNPTNVLGLYSATADITLVGALTPNDLYVDAAVLSPNGRFWVEGWDTLAPKGSVYFLGGTVQGTFGAFGGFNPSTGYGRVMTYDWRLRSNVSPPFFPQTDIYTAVRWPSQALVFASGDALYDRPQWEETAGL